MTPPFKPWDNPSLSHTTESNMKIGVMLGASGPSANLAAHIESAKTAEADGFDSVWMANIFGLDAISTLGFAGRETSRIKLGTAVTPTYPRHPTAIAQQALTTAAACDGRFVLGIGLSHKVVIENMLGHSYDKPARHMREYLSVLAPLLRGEAVNYNGEQYRVNGFSINFAEMPKVPLVVAALGPVMLDLTGRLADGTITWMTGPATLESHIIPGISKGAAAEGKPQPSVIVGMPIVLTNDEDGARNFIGQTLAMYGQLPSYRAMLDKEGAAGPADLAMVGDEATLRAGLARLRDMGVTDFGAAISASDSETHARTQAFLKAEASA
tara:strand:+ start:28544 stop:29521 length:978 start_codon:yes stop_codon:yes gene_type:complete